MTLEPMKSPWKSVAELDSETSYLVLASSIPPKSIVSTWKLFRGSMAVRRQLLAADGVIGFSMLAEPFRKHYATLSVWRGATRRAVVSDRPRDDRQSSCRKRGQ